LYFIVCGTLDRSWRPSMPLLSYLFFHL